MTTTLDLLSVSLVILFLVLMVLMLLCWMLRQSKRDLTVLQISKGQPPRTLTIKTQSSGVQPLLDSLLDRVFFMDESSAQQGGEVPEGQGSVPGEKTPQTLEKQGDVGEDADNVPQPDPGTSAADSSTVVSTLKTLPTKLEQWFDAIPEPCQDQVDSLCSQLSFASAVSHISGSCCCCLPCEKQEEENHPHNETQL